MRISETYGGDYLTAAEIGTRRVQVTVRHVGQARFEQPGGGAEQKAVLYFEGKEKGLCLNRTNASLLAAAWGDETDHWLGRTLELYTEPTSYMGKPCLGLRVQPITLGD